MVRHDCPARESDPWSPPNFADCSHQQEAADPAQVWPGASRRAFRFWAVATAVLAGALLGIGLATFARTTAGQPAAREPLSKRYETKNGWGELRVPDGWVEKAFAALEEGELKVGSGADDACVKVLTEPKVILGQPMNRDEYARQVADVVKRNLEGVSVSGPRSVRVGDRPAVCYELTGRVSGIAVLFLVTVVEGERHFHQIVAVSSSSRAGANRPLLEEITLSFRESRPVAAR